MRSGLWGKGVGVGLCAIGLAAVAAHGGVIQVTAGAAEGIGFFPLQDAFDDQPALDPPTGETYTESDGGAGVAMYQDAGTGRQGYIDFGANWADVQITGTWELWNQWGRTGSTADLIYWWSDDKAKTLDAGDTLASDFGFFGNDPPPNPNSNRVWIQRYSGPAITPLDRYLIVSTEPASEGGYSNGVVEWAFTGSVPEPASMALIGAGAVVLMARSRRRGA